METPKKIFINYRRKDARGLVKQFYRCLKSYYGEAIFFDEDRIEKGEQFSEKIQAGLDSCPLLLAVIGPNWDTGIHLKRLHDPNDWVRKELELAKATNKYIIPVLIDRESAPEIDKLPTCLASGIFDRDFIKLSEEDDYWAEEIQRHLAVISKYTGLQPIIHEKPQLKEHYKKLTYCLNHDAEIKTLKTLKNQKQVLFTGAGNQQSPFNYFAERCSVDGETTFTDILPGALVKAISWDFDQLPPEEYQSSLCAKIAHAFGLPKPQDTGQAMIEVLKDHIKRLESGQSYIFWSARNSGKVHKQTDAMDRIWWDTWHTLLADRHTPNIIVLLFTEAAWLRRFKSFARFHQGKAGYLGDIKSNIHKNHLHTWRKSFISCYLRNSTTHSAHFDTTLLEETLAERLTREFSGLARLRKKLPYETAVKHLGNALSSAYHPPTQR